MPSQSPMPVTILTGTAPCIKYCNHCTILKPSTPVRIVTGNRDSRAPFLILSPARPSAPLGLAFGASQRPAGRATGTTSPGEPGTTSPRRRKERKDSQRFFSSALCSREPQKIFAALFAPLRLCAFAANPGRPRRDRNARVYRADEARLLRRLRWTRDLTSLPAAERARFHGRKLPLAPQPLASTFLGLDFLGSRFASRLAQSDDSLAPRTVQGAPQKSCRVPH